MARSIAIAGRILAPGQLAEIPEADWSDADEQWVERGLVSVLTRANGVVIVKRDAAISPPPASVPAPAEDVQEPLGKEEKPKKKTRRRTKKTE